MTHEQKIEALSNKIREALPYLKQSEEPSKLLSLSKNGNSIQSMQVSDCICIQLEPLLNDVLNWFTRTKKPFYTHFKDSYFYAYNHDDTTNILNWNLEKPYLKDQSAELINFLYSLIDNEN